MPDKSKPETSAKEKEYYSLIKVFDKLAPLYDVAAAPLTGLRKKVAALAGLKSGAAILDVATGTGKQAFAFARKGYNVTGIDLSEGMLAIAKKNNRYPNAKFEIADATKLPFADARFDASSISFALHDMPPTIGEKVLKEMTRVTRPDGAIIIVDYALPRNRIGRFLSYRLTRLYERSYYSEFIKSDIEDLLRKSGVELREATPALFGNARILRAIRIQNRVIAGQSACYIPAFGHRWLTPLFDPFIRLTMRESAFKRHLARQARLDKGHRVLDLGCGTGTLTLLLKQAQPGAEVVGLDADPQVLGIARKKAARAKLEIAFDLGMAFKLPYPDNSFDRVISSLVFHHLTTENKIRASKEAFRVLRPGGELHVADFGKPHNVLMRLISLVMGRFERTPDNIQGRLPQMFRDAGFLKVAETAWYSTLFGTLSFYRAEKPA